MRLTKIRIENYRQYRDFELPREGHLGQATLLVAHMGAGKTNLLNAINWCLYDEEMFTVDNNRSLPFINTGRLGEALSPGTESESRIQLSLSLGDDAMARVTRRQVFKVKESGQAEPKSRSELTVQVQAVGDDWVTLTSDDARDWVARYLPNRIRPYYMLNLERMQQFIQDAESDRVQKAVLAIAQIDMLERLIKRLDEVRKDWYRTSGDRPGGLLELLTKDVETYRDDLAKLEESIQKQSGAVDRLAVDIAELDAKLEVHADAFTADLNLKNAKRALMEAETSFTGLEEQLRAVIAECAGYVLAAEALSHTAGLVASEKAAHRYPPPIDTSYLREILSPEKRSCICGRSLPPGTPEFAAVEALLPENMKVNALGEFLIEHESGIAVGQDRAAGFHGRTAGLRRQLSDADAQIAKQKQAVEKHQAELDELGGVNPQVGLIKEQRTKAQHALTEAEKLIAGDKKHKEHVQELLEKTEKKYKIELHKDKSRQKTAESLEFTERCLSVATSVYEQLLGEARQRVSNALDVAFRQMMVWKPDTYTAATVDSAYHVSVRTAEGWEATGSLSGGENVCLAIAFGQALGEISGFDIPPLIFDSPLVNLDSSARTSVAMTIGEHLKDRQLVLLMKPGEFDDSVIAALEGTMPDLQIFDMAFDQAEQTTSIAER